MSSEVYPSIEELFMGAQWLSAPLRKEIATRYEELGPKYLTDELHTDGRKINGCMQKNSAQDALEEVVDAVFNMLVLRFKGYAVGNILPSLLDAYTRLLAMQQAIDLELGEKQS